MIDSRWRKRVKIFCLFLIVFYFIGCNSSQKKEKIKSVSLNLHVWEGYAKKYQNAFKKYALKKYKLEVSLKISYSSGLQSFVEAIKKNNVHLISPASDLLLALKDKSLIQEINEKRLKNYSQINPIILNKKKPHMIKGKVYGIPFTYGFYLMAYNKRIVQKAPESYWELWNPKYRKMVSISGDYATANIYMTALMLKYPPEDIFELKKKQLKQIELELKKLARHQVKEYWKKNLNPQSFKRLALAMDWGIGVKLINEKYKGNWGLVIPKEGVTGWLDTWSITKNVKDKWTKLAAYAFIDFMISSQIQAEVVRVTSYCPVNLYTGRYLSIEEKRKYNLLEPLFQDSSILWKALNKKNRKRYSQLWKRVRNVK